MANAGGERRTKQRRRQYGSGGTNPSVPGAQPGQPLTSTADLQPGQHAARLARRSPARTRPATSRPGCRRSPAASHWPDRCDPQPSRAQGAPLLPRGHRAPSQSPPVAACAALHALTMHDKCQNDTKCPKFSAPSASAAAAAAAATCVGSRRSWQVQNNITAAAASAPPPRSAGRLPRRHGC